MWLSLGEVAQPLGLRVGWGAEPCPAAVMCKEHPTDFGPLGALLYVGGGYGREFATLRGASASAHPLLSFRPAYQPEVQGAVTRLERMSEGRCGPAQRVGVRVQRSRKIDEQASPLRYGSVIIAHLPLNGVGFEPTR